MKTKITSLVLIIALSLVSFISAKAKTNEALSVSMRSTGRVVLKYTSATEKATKVTILDANKKFIFSERLSNKNKVVRVYNITALPEGDYYFEVVENGVKSIKTVTYKKEVEVKALKFEVTPSEVAGKFEVVCKSKGEGPVTISIYGKKQGLLFEDAVNAQANFKRVYDLSKLPEDEYVFEATKGEIITAKEVSLTK